MLLIRFYHLQCSFYYIYVVNYDIVFIFFLLGIRTIVNLWSRNKLIIIIIIIIYSSIGIVKIHCNVAILQCSKEVSNAWKSVELRVFSGLYSPVFGLKTDIYSVNICIQSEYHCTKNKAFH